MIGSNRYILSLYFSTIWFSHLSLFKTGPCALCIFFLFSTHQCIDCRYQGKIFKSGESFPKGDKCNTCICSITGQVRCTEISCADNTKNTALTSSYYSKQCSDVFNKKSIQISALHKECIASTHVKENNQELNQN